MSHIEKVIEKYIGQSDQFVGILHDLTYSLVLGIVLNHLEQTLKNEQVSVQNCKGNDSEKLLVETEELKLKQFITELNEAQLTTITRLDDMIKNRYMR